MNNENEKLKQCLFEAMEADVEKLKKQTESSEPHVFSQKFEAGMQVIIDSVEKKSKRRVMMKNFAVASAAALVLVIGGISISTSNVTASKSVVDIVAWVKEYFNFENGDEYQEVALSFDESRIMYIPEGFIKDTEQMLFNYVTYEYKNQQEMYFNISVFRNKSSYQQDDKNIDYEIKLSESGCEYSYVYNTDKEVYTLLWENKEGIFYRLDGNIDLDELIMIMNNIKY